ncbi:MAG: flagellar motor switch phosphatase FliY [Oscillospiraceae bacterium]|nr:flagellar motor switch phosphatase FliY [Oscillospiraceae bacterium]
MSDNLSQEEMDKMLALMDENSGDGEGGGGDPPEEPPVSESSGDDENIDETIIESVDDAAGGDEITGKDAGGSLTAMDLDVLGEVYNVSMGAAASAVSSLLRMKVDITTPQLTVLKESDLAFKSLEPAVGVEINYIVGIQGVNIFILSQLDVMKIVDIWMGGPGQVDESAEFNEMHMSAIGEVMNQMMGQSSMGLAGFLNTVIDISAPVVYKIEGDYSLAKRDPDTEIVATKFKLIVGDNIIDSELITTCDIDFAKSMINMAQIAFGVSDGSNQNVQGVVEGVKHTDDVPVTAAQQQPAAASVQQQPEPQRQQQPAASAAAPQAPTPQQINTNTYQQPPPEYYPPPPASRAQNVHAQPVSFGSFDIQDDLSGGYMGNINLIRSVPLNISVEIGRTRLPVREILEEFGEGHIVELDRQAADLIDIYANGVLIAKGSVVVVEENFGVKIMEIVAPEELIRVAGMN